MLYPLKNDKEENMSIKQPIVCETDLAYPAESKLISVSHTDDINTEVIELTVKQDGAEIDLSGKTVTARYAAHSAPTVLINDNVNCAVSQSGHIMVPFDNTVLSGYSGEIDIEISISDGSDVLTLPYPLWVRVRSSILESAVISERTRGLVAELLESVRAELDRVDGYTTDEEVFAILDDAFSGTQNLSPALRLDNVNSLNEYILYFVDSDDVRHEFFNFSRFFAEKATTLAGYGITNAYTKAELDAVLPEMLSRVVENLAEKISENIEYFTLDSQTLDGVTVTDHGDGSYTFNGTNTTTTLFPAFTLPAGAYTARIEIVSGSGTAQGAIKYGSGSGTTWLNTNNTEADITFNSETRVFFRLNRGEFTNWKMKISITREDDITAVDKVAREDISGLQTAVSGKASGAEIAELNRKIAAADTGKEIAQGAVGISKFDFVRTGDNLFNRNGKHTEGRIGDGGRLINTDIYVTSEYIPVSANTVYYVNGYRLNNSYKNLRFVAEYNSDLEFIKLNENVSESLTTDSCAAFVRIVYPPANAYMTYFGTAVYSGQKYEAVIPGEIVDLSLVQAQINNINGSLSAQSGPLYPLVEPDGFTWKNSPLHGKILTDFRGVYQVDFDVTSYKNNPGKVLYVSPDGPDSNAGTPEAPLANMSTAYNNGADTIYLYPGKYYRPATLFGTEINRDLNIIGLGDGVILSPRIINIPNTSPNVTEYSTGVWRCYSNGTTYLSNVVDIAHKTSDGHFTKYTQIEGANASQVKAAVQATAGSWALIEEAIVINGVETNKIVAYIHTLSGENPLDGDDVLLLYSTAPSDDPTDSHVYPLIKVTGGKVYFENLTCIEGSTPLLAQRQAGGENIEIYAKNCKFFYSRSTYYDACMLYGTTLSIFQNCEASFSQKDGFGYHAKESIIPKGIEINCVGAGNGNVEDGNDQGSTMHNGGSIIRVRNVCSKNYGANYADQGTGTESWNIGCVGFESLTDPSYSGTSDAQKSNFFAYDNTKVFCDGCVGFGSLYNVCTSGTGTIYLRNSRFEGALAQNGVTLVYY